jgi:hypothetical protein
MDSEKGESLTLEVLQQDTPLQSLGNDALDEKAERKVRLKLDSVLLPLLSLCIFFGYLVSSLGINESQPVPDRFR